MVVAPIRHDCMDRLKSLLESMSDPPGMAKPDDARFPFEKFDTLHYARFVILDDKTVGDFKEAGERIPHYDPSLAFLGDCDGPGDAFLAKAADVAGNGLCEIFSHCIDPPSPGNLLWWMRQHSLRPAAAYVNYVGRTVCQIRQEEALRSAVVGYLKKNPPAAGNPKATHRAVIGFVNGSELKLPVEAPTPAAWRVAPARCCEHQSFTSTPFCFASMSSRTRLRRPRLGPWTMWPASCGIRPLMRTASCSWLPSRASARSRG